MAKRADFALVGFIRENLSEWNLPEWNLSESYNSNAEPARFEETLSDIWGDLPVKFIYM